MRLVCGFLVALLVQAQAGAADSTTIAFGSCLRQWKPAPVLDTVAALQPDVFIFSGDNVYTDVGPWRSSKEPERIALAYRQLAEKPGYRALRQSTRVLATWDDHDYGRNNAGAEYPWKAESKAAFVEFFSIPPHASVHHRDGVYSAHLIGDADHRIQIILLDTRTFRGPLQEAAVNAQCPRSRLVPSGDRSVTVLGPQQWHWLEQQLQQPVALRLIVSSIQVIPEQHCYEKWANFPHERDRLLDLLSEPGAPRTLLLSGDRHLGEISMLAGSDGRFPLYEVTASGLNSAGAGRGEVNRHRLTDENVRSDHFGLIRYHHDAPARVEVALLSSQGSALQQIILDYQTWQIRKAAASEQQ
jgi:alkaline phosphatase D